MLRGETVLTGARRHCSACGVTMDFEVLRSAAGYYIGTRCDCGPNSRETSYFPTYELAAALLKSGNWLNYAR